MKLFDVDVNKINCSYFSKGAQLNFYQEEFLTLLPPEEALFARHLKSGQKVLDIGCGAGRTTAHVRKVTEDVVGIDLSEVLIESARQKHPEVDFRVMDAVQLDFPEQSFDVLIFSYNGLCYLHPLEKRFAAIREMERVLKKGGILILSSFNRFLPLALYALVNLVVTKLVLGFNSKYVIHLTRHGMTVNYETTPEEETALFRQHNFELIEQVPMTEKVGSLGYQPAVLTYYAFRKL